MGNWDGSSSMEDYQDIMVMSLSSPEKDPLMTQEGALSSQGRGPPGPSCLPRPPGTGFPGPPPPDPPRGGSLGPPGDLGSQGPSR